MSDPARPNTFTFTCSDLVHRLREKLQRMIDLFGDLFLPNTVTDGVLLRFMSIVLSGYLNAYYVDAMGYLINQVFQRQRLHTGHMQYLYDEVIASMSTCLAARSTIPSDWINRPPERQYQVDVREEQQGICIVWTA